MMNGRIYTPELAEMAFRLRERGFMLKHIAEELEVSIPTINRWLMKHKISSLSKK